MLPARIAPPRAVGERARAGVPPLPGGSAMSGSMVGLFSRVFRVGDPRAGGLVSPEAGPEQHILQAPSTKIENGVVVMIPPRYHRVITLRLAIDPGSARIHAARERLERVLADLDRRYPPTAYGLGLTLAWGLPYFRRYTPGPAERCLPVDQLASELRGERTLAILDAIRFPSDPEELILEENDAAVLLRSDEPGHIDAATDALFAADLDFWTMTSARNGFIGGDGIGLPKQKALEAAIPGASDIPDGAQLFMGFTSSQKAALGSDRIANLETIPGLTDQWPDGYFRYGTTMHLSHLDEDLAGWYGSLAYQERVARAFRPGLDVEAGTQTVPEGPSQIESERQVARDLAEHGLVGHSAALQPATRLAADLIDNYGTFHPQGSAIPQRADFNTLDNPFSWSADPVRDSQSSEPRAGLHFLVFVPTSSAFHRGRLAMDGHYASGAMLPIGPRAREQGMNAFLRTTHRQNFLVPPRSHRSFPLSELL